MIRPYSLASLLGTPPPPHNDSTITGTYNSNHAMEGPRLGQSQNQLPSGPWYDYKNRLEKTQAKPAPQKLLSQVEVSMRAAPLRQDPESHQTWETALWVFCLYFFAFVNQSLSFLSLFDLGRPEPIPQIQR